MSRVFAFICVTLLICVSLSGSSVQAQWKEDRTVQASSAVLGEIMAVPLNGIPRSMLTDAQGIAVIPNVIKGGFVIGARYGTGTLLVRDPIGNWHAPVFVTLTGGNVGWQVGVQSTDVILVFKTRKSIDGLLSGKFTLGVDAAAAAGPVGRQAAAATDVKLKAEIYSYSRSRGLFAGVSIDGSVLRVDHIANATYYRSSGPGQPVVVPESAVRLVNQVAAHCGAPPAQAAASKVQPASLAQDHAVSEADALRGQLARVAPELYELVDPQWRAYLALPADVFTGNGHASMESLKRSLAHFDAVAANPQYGVLTERPEFQSTHGLLKHYISARSERGGPLNLPPPPGKD